MKTELRPTSQPRSKLRARQTQTVRGLPFPAKKPQQDLKKQVDKQEKLSR
jgi:hypothetical protein